MGPGASQPPHIVPGAQHLLLTMLHCCADSQACRKSFLCVASADRVAPLSAGQSAEREGRLLAVLARGRLPIPSSAILPWHVLLAGLPFVLSAQLPAPASQQASGQQDAVNSFREAEAAATETCPEAAQRASAPDFRTPQRLLQQVWHTACKAALR